MRSDAIRQPDQDTAGFHWRIVMHQAHRGPARIIYDKVHGDALANQSTRAMRPVLDASSLQVGEIAVNGHRCMGSQITEAIVTAKDINKKEDSVAVTMPQHKAGILANDLQYRAGGGPIVICPSAPTVVNNESPCEHK